MIMHTTDLCALRVFEAELKHIEGTLKATSNCKARHQVALAGLAPQSVQCDLKTAAMRCTLVKYLNGDYCVLKSRVRYLRQWMLWMGQ